MLQVIFYAVLASLQASSDLIKMKTDEYKIEDIESTISNMDRTIKNANVLISELLSISKDKDQNSKIFNVNDSILDITGIIGNILNASVKIETQLESISMIDADRVWIAVGRKPFLRFRDSRARH